MADSSHDKKDLDIARRQESKAYNEREFCSHQAKEQQSQLDSILEYRNECMEGLSNARETGLSPAQVREYQLLMKHINSTVEVIEYKVTATQDNLDKADQVWQKKNEHFVVVKESVKQQSIAEDEEPEETPKESPKETAIIVKKYYGSDF